MYQHLYKPNNATDASQSGHYSKEGNSLESPVIGLHIGLQGNIGNEVPPCWCDV